MPSSKISPRAFAVAVAGTGLALFVVLALTEGPDLELSPAFWLFAGLIALGEIRPVYQQRGASVIGWTLSTPFMFALLLYKGPATAILVSAGATVAADLVNRRGWDRALFNAGQYTVALGAAGLTLAWLGYVPGSLLLDTAAAVFWPVIPAMVVFLLMSDVLVAGVTSLDQAGAFRDLLREELLFSGPINGVLLGIAPVLTVVAGINLALLAPFVVLVLGIHRWTRLMVEKEHQAQHDMMTGLPNRTLFTARLELALETATGVTGPAVVLFDLNAFKDVNDTLGHQAGDELLCVIGNRLADAVGEAVLARLAADEFAVLLPAVQDPDEAVEAAAGLQAILRQPLDVGGFSLAVTASAGIASYPEHGRDATTLLRRAEVAMYVAKDKHGGIEVYRPVNDQSSRRRLSLLHELRRAVEAGDLTLAYQPKAETGTGRVVGMEALVRWNHPEHGAVSPSEFIPLAERTGLIVPITEQVLEMAMAECARWHRGRFALSVAVNISPQAIYDRQLQQTTFRLISRWGLDARWLTMEMTESTIMSDPDLAAEVLNNAANIGVHLSIDDFGTGYSSLALLKQLPVHELKVDRSFVEHIAHDQSDAAIVRTTVQLARSLGMTVCAEGVETLQAWERVRELGCDVAQGYLLARPLPGPEIMSWLLDRIPGPDTWAPSAAPAGSPAEPPAPVVDFAKRRAT